ncbi:hypothetical protein GCM10027440_09150 [Nocardiopsis coralliicola]
MSGMRDSRLQDGPVEGGGVRHGHRQGVQGAEQEEAPAAYAPAPQPMHRGSARPAPARPAAAQPGPAYPP